ncbi:hypothetical protein V2I01_36030 [Micromonospora sp. BRA006-A]|nr:hypothetical protein [Micromonospora sp. BRA006-A]
MNVPDGPSLAAATAVRTLLSDSYRDLDTKDQDEFFSRSASGVFDTLFTKTVETEGAL